MGIVNLTVDSFSGDGVGSDAARAIAHALSLAEAGADILDLGAESSRPGALPVALEDEAARLLPVIRALRDCGLPLSVDTSKPEVMHMALDEGVSIINDIRALEAPGALEAVRGSDCALCLMHMQGEPASMQRAPSYTNVTGEVTSYLRERLRMAEGAGIDRRRCWIDPGLGFGKSFEHNLALFRRLPELAHEGVPVLVGVSRKSMLGAITGRPVDERLPAGLAAAVVAAQAGVSVIRVHDVAATVDALNTWRALAPPNEGMEG
jgi:dihydropteroate synthase